jgi:hypothetical protein
MSISSPRAASATPLGLKPISTEGEEIPGWREVSLVERFLASSTPTRDKPHSRSKNPRSRSIAESGFFLTGCCFCLTIPTPHPLADKKPIVNRSPTAADESD